MRIGNSLVMVSGTAARTARRSLLYLYVKDVDATYERALQAGAKSLESPTVVSYGDRRAIIKDPAGNEWQVATPRAVARKSLSR
jgi:PhnB protein